MKKSYLIMFALFLVVTACEKKSSDVKPDEGAEEAVVTADAGATEDAATDNAKDGDAKAAKEEATEAEDTEPQE